MSVHSEVDACFQKTSHDQRGQSLSIGYSTFVVGFTILEGLVSAHPHLSLGRESLPQRRMRRRRMGRRGSWRIRRIMCIRRKNA